MQTEIFTLSSYSLNLWSLPHAFISLILIALALKIFYQDRFEKTVLTLNLLLLFVLIWQICFFFLFSSVNEATAYWWAKAAYLGIPFIPPALYLFVLTALRRYEKHRRVNALIWVFALLSSMLIVGTDVVIPRVKLFRWGYYAQYTLWSIIYLIPFGITLWMSYSELRTAYKQKTYRSNQHLRIRSFLLAFGIGGLAVIDYLAKFNLSVYPFGSMAILACLIIVESAIAKYQLYDITPTFAAASILETMEEALITIDVDGIIRLVNRAAIEMFGLTEDELTGSPYAVIMGEGALAVSQENTLSDLMHCCEFSYRHPHHGQQILGMSVSMMKDSKGNVMATICTIRNVTKIRQIEAELRDSHHSLEKKVEERTLALKAINDKLVSESQERLLAEQAARKSEEMYRLLTEIAPNAISVADPNGIMRMLNKRALELYMHEDENEVIGKSIFEWVLPEERQRAASAFESLLKVGFVSNVELVLLRKNGSSFPAIINASLLRASNGEPQLVIIVTTDVSEQKMIEEERLKTQKLESIGTLAGGIAHDFNNLLQGVFGYISMAKLTHDQKDKSLAMLDQAEEALHMSVNLTNQLLTFSKGGKPVKKLIKLQPTIENAVKFALSGSHTDHRMDITPDLWSVEADAGQLAQVIQNIVLNANQAMPDGGSIEISAENKIIQDGENHQLPGGERFVKIDIRDSGIGILPQHITKIFDPYFTTKQRGSGLGLATSYSIIKNHGGLIEVNSEINKGTTLTIYLPASREVEAEIAKAAPTAVGTKKLTVLLMDDEELVRHVATEMIGKLGHEVESAEDGKRAIELFRQARDAGKPFDLLILDLTVKGGMGGEEAIAKIRAIDSNVRAVVSSGYADSPVVADYRAYGFSAVLNKTYRIDSLKDCLNQFFS